MTSSADRKIVVAVDGFSSSGKSTLARRLAAHTGYRYIDSGAMYRAVTLWAMRHGLVNTETHTVDADNLSRRLDEIHIDFKVGENGQETILNGENVEREIRSLYVSNNVSPVSAIASVRKALTAMQQQMGREKGIVMDGRDIGTTVFPDAELKLYIDAPAETRAKRRQLELQQKGMPASYDEVLKNITERDYIDLNRKESPLRCADDAIRLDNSSLSLERQDEVVLDLFKKALEHAED